MYLGPLVKCPLLCPILQNPNARTYFSKVPNTKFYDSSSGEGCALPCRQKDVTRPTDRSSKLLYDRTIRTIEKAERENGIIEVGAKEEERIRKIM